jgi:predicted transcriptional regulator
MSRHNRTKDENFILCLYEEAEKTGDLEGAVDRYQVGVAANLHPKGVDTICKLLIQANFIKKASESEVYLTPHGINLVKELRLE